MNPNERNTTGKAWEVSGDRARQYIREYRAVLNGYAAVPDTVGVTTVAAPTPLKALTVPDLPVEMRHLLKRYEREHPGTVVQPVAYITGGAPDAISNTFGFTDLPPEEDLVILALTETVASAGRVEARSQVLLLRCGEIL